MSDNLPSTSKEGVLFSWGLLSKYGNFLRKSAWKIVLALLVSGHLVTSHLTTKELTEEQKRNKDAVLAEQKKQDQRLDRIEKAIEVCLAQPQPCKPKALRKPKGATAP